MDEGVSEAFSPFHSPGQQPPSFLPMWQDAAYYVFIMLPAERFHFSPFLVQVPISEMFLKAGCSKNQYHWTESPCLPSLMDINNK